MSTIVKFEAAEFETALDKAREAVAELDKERLAALVVAGPSSLPTIKAALKHVTPIRTRLVETRRIAKRHIDDAAADLLLRVAEVEDPLQNAVRAIEAAEENEAAKRVAEAEEAARATQEAKEREQEAERKRLAEENARLKAELDAERAARAEAAEAERTSRSNTPENRPVSTQTVVEQTENLAHGAKDHSEPLLGSGGLEEVLSSFKGSSTLQGSDADAIHRFGHEFGEWMAQNKPYLIEPAAMQWWTTHAAPLRTFYRQCKEYQQ